MTTTLLSYARRPYWRVAVLSAGAAAAAYGLGSLSPHVSAVVAAITALVSVRPTFHSSLREALRQVLGVVIGAVFAFAALELVGASVLALFGAIVACFITASILRLGEEGAVAVGVTVILVVGPQFSTLAIEARLFGVVVGSALALVVSYFTRPGTPHGRALADVVELGERASALLTGIGTALADREGHLAAVLADRWLAEAEDILARTTETKHLAEDAVAGARWSPMIGHAEAQAVLAQVKLTEATAITLVGMCRDLQVAAGRDSAMPPGMATSLSHVLLATAGAITEQAETARGNPAETLDDDAVVMGAATRTRKQAASVVRGLDDTRPLLLGGSLLRDTEKITEILSGR
ncbi:MAG: aromatic acid exporter family protein [Actinomycetales bacterium]|nr:aromatic acid exporter family protein [Actinomycetales bacterium]